MTISEAFDKYYLDIIAFRGQSTKTQQANEACKRRMVRYFGDIEIADLTFDMVRQWKQQLDKEVSPSTAREYIIRLRVVLMYLRHHNLAILDPNLIPVPKRPGRTPEFITKKQVDLLIRKALKKCQGYPEVNRYRNAAIISLIYASGIRISELCSLNISDMREDNTFTVIGKGNKARLCFFDARTRKLLDSYLELRRDSNPALFVANETGERIKPNNVQRFFRIISSKVGLPVAVHPHVLRHSFATDLLRNNCNIRYVQAFLGHSSLETTQIYTHIINVDLKQAYTRFHTV